MYIASLFYLDTTRKEVVRTFCDFFNNITIYMNTLTYFFEITCLINMCEIPYYSLPSKSCTIH